MKRALIITAVAAGAVCVSAAPAFAGLAGNASFSWHIPVPVPSGATAAQLTDDNHDRGESPSATSTNAGDNRGPGTSRGPGEAEPGDDRGNDNHGTGAPGEPEPTDDRGGLRTSGEVEPGDNRGHDGATPTSGHGSGGGDDGIRMGGHG
jgi:hypothetical protein